MPYCLGLQSAANAFLSIGFSTQFTLAIIVSLTIIMLSSSFQKDPIDAPAPLPGSSVFHILPFFRRRFDFLNWGFHASGHNIFRFNLLRNTVIVVSGESARQSFFTAKGLDLTEGFKILSGAIPMVRGVTSDLQARRVHLIHKRLANIQRNAPLSNLIPILLEDSRTHMESWGPSGKFDPFEKVYELVFQLTIRSLSCTEIADNPALVARLKRLYDDLDTGTTPATVLLPWLPTPAMLRKLWSTKEIYDIVNKAICDRQASGVAGNDALQMLLDCGDEKLVVVGFIMGLLIAGARATGTTASWLLTFLGGHPEWRSKAAAEVEALLAYASPTPHLPSHASTSTSTPTPQQSLSSRLATIPLDVWETQTPILDAIIRETTRIAQPHTAMRRNLGPDCYIDDKRVPTGAYVVYPFSDVHLDPEVYDDPWKFDPGRSFKVGEDGVKGEGEGVPFGYVGWGGGKTVCLGTRLAKVELKLVTAMFVLGFEHSVVDPVSGAPAKMPTPNWNDILLCRPPQGSFGIGYKRTQIPL